MEQRQDLPGEDFRLEPKQFNDARESVEKTKLAASAPWVCHPSKAPESDEAAWRRIQEAFEWASKLDEAKGYMAAPFDFAGTNARGLLGCFSGGGHLGVEGWRLSQFIGVPPDHLTQPVGKSSFEVFLGKNARKKLIPRPAVEVDVVTDHYNDQHAAFAYADEPRKNWKRIGEQLFFAYLAERTAALQLCAWVHDAIDRYMQAQQFDLVFYKPPNKKSRSKVIIETAAGPLPPIQIDGKDGVPPAVYYAFKAWYKSKAPASKKLISLDKSLMYKFRNAAMLTGIVRSASKSPKRGRFAMDEWMRVHLKFK